MMLERYKTVFLVKKINEVFLRGSLLFCHSFNKKEATNTLTQILITHAPAACST